MTDSMACYWLRHERSLMSHQTGLGILFVILMVLRRRGVSEMEKLVN